MKKIALLLITIFTLGGCSSKFAYNNIDWLIYWFLDDYIELTSEQESVFDEKLQNWISWHKSEELPQYIEHMDQLISDIKSDQMTQQRMAYHQEKARSHWVRLRAQVAPDLVEMSKLLDDEQVVYLFAALEDDNQEEKEAYLERVSYSEEKRERRWSKRNQDNASDWFGRLNKQQKDYISDSYGQFESTGQHWIDYKQNYQSNLRSLFVTREINEDFDAELLEMLTQPEQYRSDEFNQASERNNEKSKQYLIKLMSMATDKQKQKLIDKIGDYREDILDLANRR
ncbi:MAG: DUF6279 family lipoprotein [Pseudomonadota bacterium]